MFPRVRCNRIVGKRLNTRKGALRLILSLLLTATAVMAQQSTAPENGPEKYVLSSGDVIELRFSYSPDLNEKVAVRPDGKISLPVVGEISVENETPGSLSTLLTERYAKFFKRPEVTVIVREFAERRAYVGGEVATPGVVPLKGAPVTCLQAVLAAGGAKTTAKLDKVLLVRHVGSNQAEVKSVNLKGVIKGSAGDLLLQPFDVVYVPRSKIGKVNVFVEQYVNGLLPRNIVFPYNLNTNFKIE